MYKWDEISWSNVVYGLTSKLYCCSLFFMLWFLNCCSRPSVMISCFRSLCNSYGICTCCFDICRSFRSLCNVFLFQVPCWQYKIHLYFSFPAKGLMQFLCNSPPCLIFDLSSSELSVESFLHWNYVRTVEQEYRIHRVQVALVFPYEFVFAWCQFPGFH